MSNSVQTNPADMKALCSSLQPQMAGNITEKCSGDAQSSAVAVYSSSCLASESITISALYILLPAAPPRIVLMFI